MWCLHMAVSAATGTFCKLHALNSCLPSSVCDASYQRKPLGWEEKDLTAFHGWGTLSLMTRQQGRFNTIQTSTRTRFSLGCTSNKLRKALTFKPLHTVCNPVETSDGIASVTSMSAKFPPKCKHITNAGEFKMMGKKCYFWFVCFCPQPSFYVWTFSWPQPQVIG